MILWYQKIIEKYRIENKKKRLKILQNLTLQLINVIKLFALDSYYKYFLIIYNNKFRIY